MAVAVQAQAGCWGRRLGRVHHGQRLAAGGLPAGQLGRRDHIRRQQARHGVVAKGLGSQVAPGGKSPLLAHQMQPRDKAAQPAQGGRVVQLWAVAGAARAHRQPERVAGDGRVGQRLAVGQNQRRNHRHLGLCQFQRESVFFENLRVAPAPGAVELGHHHLAVFQKDLEDPVLVAVELDQPAVAAHADAVQRVQHRLRCQVLERVLAGRVGMG